MEARKIILSGRVQGVGFRYFVFKRAQRFPVSGWVRNLRDGNVEIHAEGESHPLDEFVASIRSGPPGSFVSDLEEQSTELQQLQDFEIKG